MPTATREFTYNLRNPNEPLVGVAVCSSLEMLTSSSMTGGQGSILLFAKSELLGRSLEKAFSAHGFQIMVVRTEADVFTAAKEVVPSLIIIERQLDRPLYLRQLRMSTTVPILALSHGDRARSDEEFLKDYDEEIDLVVSGETPRELVARVRAILRRRAQRSEQTRKFLRAGDIMMDLDRHEVTVGRKTIELTPKEFKILYQFMEEPGRVFSRQEMLNRVWGEGYALEEHALDVHIHSLRQKIESDPSRPNLIVTVRGVGYKLRA
jgi:two-component system, OmpR family, response regulator RegX3